jgi:hypothetical protein
MYHCVQRPCFACFKTLLLLLFFFFSPKFQTIHEGVIFLAEQILITGLNPIYRIKKKFSLHNVFLSVYVDMCNVRLLKIHK